MVRCPSVPSECFQPAPEQASYVDRGFDLPITSFPLLCLSPDGSRLCPSIAELTSSIPPLSLSRTLQTSSGALSRSKRCSYGTWWINRSAITQPMSGCFSSLGSPDRPPLPEVKLHPSPLLASSPTSSPHDTENPSSFDASQAETGGKGHESTSRAVHRRVVLPAAIAGVRCRYRCANRLPPRSRGCASTTRNDA
jgi:hypothetical protein